MSEAIHKGERRTGEVVSPVVLYLKRLTRDLKGRVDDFRGLLDEVLNAPDEVDRPRLQLLADNIAGMRGRLMESREIAMASQAAISRSDPGELIVLRDQLVAYLAALDGARLGGATLPNTPFAHPHSIPPQTTLTTPDQPATVDTGVLGGASHD